MIQPGKENSGSPKKLREGFMLKRICQLLLVAYLVPGALWAADNPFAGEWKLNPSKTKLADQMKVDAVGANKFTFDLGGGPETIVADGSDQPGGYGGTTLSAAIEGPDTWKVVRKKDGRMLLTATWKLSPDGKTLTDHCTAFDANGSAATTVLLYRRTAGESGFTGSWEDTGVTMDTVYVIKVLPFEGDGISYYDQIEGVTTSVKFDGKDYPDAGANAIPGLVFSARRLDARHVEVTDKFNGKTLDTRQLELSPDLKTLTITVPSGRGEPTILVFDRQ